MAINYTALLGLAQPVTGTESNVWGDAVNDQITALLDSAIAGAATISVTAGNVTLTDVDGSADQARMAILILTGTPGTTRNVVAPSRSKTYIVINQSDASAVIKGAATTGATVRSGQAATCVWNGTDFEIVASGDVDGPSSATDNAVPRYDGTTGKLIQNSGVTIDDSNNVSGVVQLNATTVAATTGNITTVNATTVNATTVDTTNIEVTNLKAKDGTAAGSIADSTGIVTLTSSVLTTTDINGGTIDNASIGASTPSTIRATQVDITAQGDLRLQDTTGGEYVALQAPGTLASSYTLTLPVDDGTAGQTLITDGSGVLSWTTAAAGDVVGPASATDTAIATFDGVTGKLIKNNASVTIAANIITALGFSGPHNGTVGATTPSTAAFTTLSATGAMTSTLVTGTPPLVVASTTKVANLNVDQLDGADWASPAAIGSTTPAGGAFTTLAASSTVSGTGFTNYFASPPALGTTAPAEVKVTVGWAANTALTDAATVAWDTNNQVATFTFVSSNRTMGAPTNLKNGAFYALAVIQNAGSNTLTWDSVFKWAAGTAPTLSTAAGAKDYFTFRSDGTNLYQQGISQAVA